MRWTLYVSYKYMHSFFAQLVTKLVTQLRRHARVPLIKAGRFKGPRQRLFLPDHRRDAVQRCLRAAPIRS
jgi:hypothetical protein